VSCLAEKRLRGERSFVRSFVRSLNALSRRFGKIKKMRTECLLLLRSNLFIYISARGGEDSLSLSETLCLSLFCACVVSLVVSLFKKKRAPCLLFVFFFFCKENISFFSFLNLFFRHTSSSGERDERDAKRDQKISKKISDTHHHQKNNNNNRTALFSQIISHKSIERERGDVSSERPRERLREERER